MQAKHFCDLTITQLARIFGMKQQQQQQQQQQQLQSLLSIQMRRFWCC